MDPPVRIAWRLVISPWRSWVDSELDAIVSGGLWRQTRALAAAGPRGVLTESGQEVVNFASNDYLGLTQHPAVKAAAAAAVEVWGTGSGASRLVTGTRPSHTRLEADLADWRGTGAAVVFSTGYAANTGLLATLGGPGVRIYSDALNHASIVDGCRMASNRGAEVAVYDHLDLDHLRALLGEGGAERSVVVTDSVFSMDGDVAPVAELSSMAVEHRALLVLDDAHSVFALPELHPEADVLRVGTLSKALGAVGGFVAGPIAFVELLVNRARPFVFSTAPTPADVAAAGAALGVLRSGEGAELLARLAGHVEALRPGHPSPVLPVIVGSEADALEASAALLDRGLLVPAIRPPTVPAGTSRLRVALSAAHTTEEVQVLREALEDLGLLVPTP